MRDDLFSEEDVRRDIEAAWRELAARTQAKNDALATADNAARSPLPEPIGLGWVPSLPPSPSRTPSPSAFYLGQVPPAPRWDEVPADATANSAQPESTKRPKHDGLAHALASRARPTFSIEPVQPVPDWDQVAVDPARLASVPTTTAAQVSESGAPISWLPAAQWSAPKVFTEPRAPGPPIWNSMWPENPIPKPHRQRVYDAVRQFGGDLEYYIPPELRPKVYDLARLLTFFGPGTGMAESSQDSGAMVDAAKRGDYAASAGHAASGSASGISDLLPVTKGLAVPFKALLGGVMAKTFPHARRPLAEAMEKAGWNTDDIWRAAELERGKGGKWRFEISDKGYKVNPNAGHLDEEGFRVASLFEHLNHPGVQAAYPELAQLKSRIKISPHLSYQVGQVKGDTIYIAARSMEEAERIGIHELQHLIQRIEGFPRGGSPREFVKRGYLWEQAEKLYLKIAGEVEARNAEARLKMKEWERKLRSPWRTEKEVPRDEHIILPY